MKEQHIVTVMFDDVILVRESIPLIDGMPNILRFKPNPDEIGRSLRVYESTLISVKLEPGDGRGRKLTH